MSGFAGLSYSTRNLGDEVQTLAALRFLPAAPRWVDRDALDEAHGVNSRIVMNGWFLHEPSRWPPSASLEPLLISMHLVGRPVWPHYQDFETTVLSDAGVDYLRKWGPVGCRDLYTQRLLESRNIPAYFSGCLTLTLPRSTSEKTDDVILVDVPEEVGASLRASTGRTVRTLTHRHDLEDVEDRLRAASARLDAYGAAACVVTTRLHVAMPCLALGTPVLLLRTRENDPRWTGLLELCRNQALGDPLDRKTFDLDSPRPNGERHLELADRLSARVEAFVG